MTDEKMFCVPNIPLAYVLHSNVSCLLASLVHSSSSDHPCQNFAKHHTSSEQFLGMPPSDVFSHSSVSLPRPVRLRRSTPFTVCRLDFRFNATSDVLHHNICLLHNMTRSCLVLREVVVRVLRPTNTPRPAKHCSPFSRTGLQKQCSVRTKHSDIYIYGHE